jgi:hypothetical protein
MIILQVNKRTFVSEVFVRKREMKICQKRLATCREICDRRVIRMWMDQATQHDLVKISDH